MLFPSRQKPTRMERLKLALWPRRSVMRSAKYYKGRVLRISGSPHAVSAGFASGVAASMTPFIGLHFILSFVLAFALRGNMIAAAIGTAVGNPLTFPLIWATTFQFGSQMVGEPATTFSASALSAGLFSSSFDVLWPVLQPMLIGCVPLALVAGTVSYVLVRKGLNAYHASRQQRLLARREERLTDDTSPPCDQTSSHLHP